MSKEELVAFLNDVIDALSWRRFALLTLLSSLTIALLIVLENRTTIMNRVLGTTPVEYLQEQWEVSDITRTEMSKLLEHPLIGGVLLSEVNLKKNRRYIKLWEVDDAEFRQATTSAISNQLPEAFFDTDVKNNEQMLSVLSNTFACTPTKETAFVRFFPIIYVKYPTVCRLAVPPFTGEFAGIITIFLSKNPAPSEIDSLKIVISQISLEMYLRDIQRKGRK